LAPANGGRGKTSDVNGGMCFEVGDSINTGRQTEAFNPEVGTLFHGGLGAFVNGCANGFRNQDGTGGPSPFAKRRPPIRPREIPPGKTAGTGPGDYKIAGGYKTRRLGGSHTLGRVLSTGTSRGAPAKNGAPHTREG